MHSDSESCISALPIASMITTDGASPAERNLVRHSDGDGDGEDGGGVRIEKGKDDGFQ